jgi:hypothetical protein
MYGTFAMVKDMPAQDPAYRPTYSPPSYQDVGTSGTSRKDSALPGALLARPLTVPWGGSRWLRLICFRGAILGLHQLGIGIRLPAIPAEMSGPA